MPVRPSAQVDAWMAALTVEEKCKLLGGASGWRTFPIERVGVPALKVSDGPNGVRGEGAGSRSTPGVALPVGIAQAASWDPALLQRIGDLLGREAERKRAHVVLGPTVNLQRTPIGGRTFECFSEDPELSAQLAVGIVKGIQAHDVGVTVKHFVGNDSERERMTVDVKIDERTLRELYLRPFEAAVVDAGATGIMSAYNQLNGEFCAGNRTLLTDILREEWGFDGFVVSDWYGAHDTVASAHGGMTLEMPGPSRVYGKALFKAFSEGLVEEKRIDELVSDLLALIERTHAVERSADGEERTVDDPAERALCREAAVAAMVLLRNDGLLPLNPDALKTVALIGPNALETRTMGGGSSSLRPISQRTILEALTDRLEATLVYEKGVSIDKATALPLRDQLVGPDGAPGLVIQYANGRDADAPALFEDRSSNGLVTLFGTVPPGVTPRSFQIRLVGSYLPMVDGPHKVGAITTGGLTLDIGDRRLVEDPERLVERSDAFFGYGSIEQVGVVQLTAGVPVSIHAVMGGDGGFVALRLGIEPPEPADLMDRAVAAAAAADVAIVVVGTNDEWETEGSDRDTIALPGLQDELVRRVVAANPRTIVVVNAGSPVSMPWADDVSAIVTTFFAGMEQADALVDVLTGVADPGGRLPITYPKRLEDCPAWPYYFPVDGVQSYGERWRMGYRGYEAAGTEVLFPFGHGLSYGDVSWISATASATEISPGGRVTVQVELVNTGARAGTAVVQGYVAARSIASDGMGGLEAQDRPAKELRAWAKVSLGAGESATAEVRFPALAFRRWDSDAHGWVTDAGSYELVLCASATDERFRLPLRIIPVS